MSFRSVFLCASLFAASTLLAACTHPTAKTASDHSTAQPAGEPALTAKEIEERAAVPALAHTSIADLEKLVAQGDTGAHVELGTRYGLGQGVERNYGKAIELIQVAAHRNDPVAEFFLGTAYYHGAGVPKDEAAAVLWTERAASHGFALAQYWMGMYVTTGVGGIAPTYRGDMPYFRKAALQGNVEAAFYLGKGYDKGFDIDRDVKSAAYWYRYANSIGSNAQAAVDLAVLLRAGAVDWEPGDPIPDPKQKQKAVTEPAAPAP